MDESARVRWGRVVWAFIRAGWSPPKPDERIVEAVTMDVRRVSRDRALWNGRSMTPTLELTAGEERALILAAEGMTTPQAAQAVGVSRETMKAQLTAARRKLGAASTTHAVAVAVRRGLIE